jgi:carotenoid phi-ring synthase / carotenoid chi-ring synthase
MAALIAVVVALGAIWLGWQPLVARLVRARLGAYRQRVVEPDASLPLHASEPRRVAVIGGGLAGIAAASALAERGLEVTIFEREPQLGGKCTGFHLAIDGREVAIDHGFHAFFGHYYNLNAFLERTDVARSMRRIDDYVIMTRDGRRWGFRDLEARPVLNLIALWRHGLYRMREVIFTKARDELGVFLEYDPDHTFAGLDDVSFAQFADRACLPPSLRIVFNTFARAFFADESRLSTAELVKSFHFYYLSHDRGLIYDYLEGDYAEAFVAPITDHLERLGVVLRLGAQVEGLEHRFGGWSIDGARFDHVVMATTSRGARAIAEASLTQIAPDLVRRLRRLPNGQRYAVLRIWSDARLRDDVPVFVATERERLLDSVTSLHRIGDEARRWAGAKRSLLELHCYAVPDEVADEAVEATLIAELAQFFPEIDPTSIVLTHLQLRDDFSAYHVGLHTDRPVTATEIETLVLAGDWVKLPVPAMLMEAAFTSGLYAANAVLAREGLRGHAIDSVPARGVFAALGPRRRERARPASRKSPSRDERLATIAKPRRRDASIVE